MIEPSAAVIIDLERVGRVDRLEGGARSLGRHPSDFVVLKPLWKRFAVHEILTRGTRSRSRGRNPLRKHGRRGQLLWLAFGAWT